MADLKGSGSAVAGLELGPLGRLSSGTANNHERGAVMPAPTPLIFAGVGSGLALGAQVVAQATAPGSDALQYGATGVLGLVVLALIYAVSQGRLVSQATAVSAEQGAERERRLLELAEDSRKREEALATALNRQFELFLELQKGGRHDT